MAADIGVIVFLERSANLISTALAILKAGGFYIPLNPTDPAPRLRATADDTGSRFLCTDRHMLEVLTATGLADGRQTLVLDELPRSDEGQAPNPEPRAQKPLSFRV